MEWSRFKLSKKNGVQDSRRFCGSNYFEKMKEQPCCISKTDFLRRINLCYFSREAKEIWMSIVFTNFGIEYECKKYVQIMLTLCQGKTVTEIFSNIKNSVLKASC